MQLDFDAALVRVVARVLQASLAVSNNDCVRILTEKLGQLYLLPLNQAFFDRKN